MPSSQRRAPPPAVGAPSGAPASASALLQLPPLSPWNAVWLLQAALDVPMALQGLIFPQTLPLIDEGLGVTLVIKLYASLALALAAASLLVFQLPDYMPGKRALAIQSAVYHSLASSILLSTPRCVPVTWGSAAEALRLYPENVLGCAHGVLVLGFTVWWQSTLGVTKTAGGSKKLQ